MAFLENSVRKTPMWPSVNIQNGIWTKAISLLSSYRLISLWLISFWLCISISQHNLLYPSSKQQQQQQQQQQQHWTSCYIPCQVALGQTKTIRINWIVLRGDINLALHYFSLEIRDSYCKTNIIFWWSSRKHLKDFSNLCVIVVSCSKSLKYGLLAINPIATNFLEVSFFVLVLVTDNTIRKDSASDK